MIDKIICIEVFKEILIEIVNGMEFDRYCQVVNVLLFIEIYFLVLICNNNYNIRDIKERFLGINSVYF